ncbi:TIR domain-containing protein [Phormidium yuhuli AB48]|uniref:TIR domain-containing protein n=1 Tax=Phormidium yuhuli AB48 TaxID=2940671 RepID=A0ABY5ALG7_9CYAN|nr:TIR domain-containing protein [Phormidium yuhuli]USR89665.1 TIR domain-containing protein [Phormidium yuhuli AB48]
MTDAFISYCRRDKEFVQKLYKSFGDSKREVWVDWENIPLNSDWRDEIYRGIEGADNFIFVLSPDSVASQVCREEVDYAVVNNKRLVPIVHKEVSYDEVHPELAKLNWIFFYDDPETFEGAFPKLLSTLDTDLDHVKAHTRLQKRALEWDSKKRNPSYALRGDDLKQAEHWLGMGEGKDPKPTSLQTQYVIASGQEQSKRQKATITGVAAGLVVTLVLAVVAVKERSEAVQQRNLAREQNVRALVALAQARKFTDDDLEALQFAVQAASNLKSGQNFPAELQVQTFDTLRDAVYNVQERNRFNGHQDQINRIRYAPNGEFLVSASDDSTVRIWNIDGSVKQILEHDDNVRQVDIFPDSDRIISTSQDGTAKIWQVEDGELLKTLNHNAGARAVRVHPQEAYIVTGDVDGRVWIWDNDGSLKASFVAHQGDVNDMIFSADGSTLFTSGHDTFVKQWSLEALVGTTGGRSEEMNNEDSDEEASIPEPIDIPEIVNIRENPLAQDQPLLPIQVFAGHSDKVWDIDLSLDGTYLASASSDNTVIIWELDGQPYQTLRAHNNWVRSVSFSPDGTTLVTGSDDDTVRLWNLQGILLRTFSGHDASVRSVQFAPDGTTIASGSDDATVRLRSIEGAVVEILQGHRTGVKGVRFSPDNLIGSVADTTLNIWQEDGAQLLQTVEYTAGMRASHFTTDGQFVITASYDSTLQLWDLPALLNGEGREPVRLFEGHDATVKNFAVSEDGELMASAGAERRLILWRLSDGEILQQFHEVHESEATDVGFLPDNQGLVSVGGGGHVKVWSFDGDLLQEFQAHDGWINALSFSPDGQYLATASGDNTIRIWRWQDGQFETTPAAVLKGHTDWVWDVAFNRDSQLLASAGKDDTVRLWDVQGNLLKTLSAHQNWVRALDFSTDGEKLISASADRTLILWDLDPLEEMRESIEEIEMGTLMTLGCSWLEDYLRTNPTIQDGDQSMCPDV